MSNENNSTIPSFAMRVFQNDAFRKGVAAILAGAIVATISEALWPTTER